MSVVQSIDDMCFCLKVAFFHGEAFDHFASLFDDVVVLLAGVGVDCLVLFGGLHYKDSRRISAIIISRT